MIDNVLLNYEGLQQKRGKCFDKEIIRKQDPMIDLKTWKYIMPPLLDTRMKFYPPLLDTIKNFGGPPGSPTAKEVKVYCCNCQNCNLVSAKKTKKNKYCIHCFIIHCCQTLFKKFGPWPLATIKWKVNQNANLKITFLSEGLFLMYINCLCNCCYETFII